MLAIVPICSGEEAHNLLLMLDWVHQSQLGNVGFEIDSNFQAGC
jgi:hypothetical protein